MKVIEITEIEVKAALDVAKSEEVKNVLVALFCKGEKKPTPTLDDTRQSEVMRMRVLL